MEDGGSGKSASEKRHFCRRWNPKDVYLLQTMKCRSVLKDFISVGLVFFLVFWLRKLQTSDKKKKSKSFE